MSAQPSPSATLAVPAALAAFLRGVERRAAVLAELQAGDARTGDAALAAAMARFLAQAAEASMAQWPPLFWSTLLAQPALRERRLPSTVPEAPGHLDGLGTGPRAALLLRLAAGLDEAGAAAVLGLARPTYRLALQRALPHHADGRPDPQAWRQLHGTVQARLRGLDAVRLQRLVQAREAVLLGRAPLAVEACPSDVPARLRRLLAVLWSLLGLCVLAMAATFVWPQPGIRADAVVRREPLPEAEAPAATLDAGAARIAHPDFALLADPEGERLAQDADFAAWVAAQSAAGAGLDGALAPVAPVEDAEPVGLSSDLPESSDAPL